MKLWRGLSPQPRPEVEPGLLCGATLSTDMPQGNGRALMGIVYRALVIDSPLPSEPRSIGGLAVAAVAALTAGEPAELPDWFGHDVERDVAWLSALLPGEGPWWPVFRAMAWGSGKPHTNLAAPTFMAGIRAQMSGRPLTSPGFFLWRQADGRLAVADLDERGSGHASGLRAGDVVISIDGAPATRASSEVLPLYAAAAGSELDLLVERSGEVIPIRLRLVPGDVPGVVHRLLPNGIGYLSVRWFAVSEEPSRDVAALARAALRELAEGQATGLVIDLRSGLGGMANASVSIAAALCEAEVLLSIRGGDGVDRDTRRIGDPLWLERPLAVLINEQTVSAAEFLAIALEEEAGAVLVGTATSGGLNTVRFQELADGYHLALPDAIAIGPRSRAPRPGHRLQPHLVVANPDTAELAAGIDPQLEAACARLLA